jgi:hypothetical protein
MNIPFPVLIVVVVSLLLTEARAQEGLIVDQQQLGAQLDQIGRYLQPPEFAPYIGNDLRPPIVVGGEYQIPQSCRTQSVSLALVTSQFSICNAEAQELAVQIQTDGDQFITYTLAPLQVIVFDVAAGAEPVGMISTGQNYLTFNLTPGKHYTLEAQQDAWVIAEL